MLMIWDNCGSRSDFWGLIPGAIYDYRGGSDFWTVCAQNTTIYFRKNWNSEFNGIKFTGLNIFGKDIFSVII